MAIQRNGRTESVPDKDLVADIITQMFTKVVNMLEEQIPYGKKVKKTMYRQKGNRNKDRKSTLQRNQKKTSGCKSTVTEVESSPEGFKGRSEQPGERISDLEDRTMEVTEAEEQAEKMEEK